MAAEDSSCNVFLGHISLFLFASHLVVTIKASSDFCPGEESCLTLLRKLSDYVRGVKKYPIINGQVTMPSVSLWNNEVRCHPQEQQGKLRHKCLCGF